MEDSRAANAPQSNTVALARCCASQSIAAWPVTLRVTRRARGGGNGGRFGARHGREVATRPMHLAAELFSEGDVRPRLAKSRPMVLRDNARGARATQWTPHPEAEELQARLGDCIRASFDGGGILHAVHCPTRVSDSFLCGRHLLPRPLSGR